MNQHISIRFAADPAALATKWAEARRHAEGCRKALSELRQRRDNALLESAPYDEALEELVDLRTEIQKAYVDSYLGDESPSGMIAEMEQLALQKEANLVGLRDQASVAKAAADRLTQKIDAATKADSDARQREINAKEAWAKSRIIETKGKIDEAFDALRPLLEEMSAVSKYGPAPEYYISTRSYIGDHAQDIFEQLKRTTQEYPKPAHPFEHTWLRERRVDDLPGVGAAQDRLEAEIAEFMRGQR